VVFRTEGDEDVANHLFALRHSTLFEGLTDAEMDKLCTCLSAQERVIPKDGFVFRAGDKVNAVYCILSGSMHIVDEDYWGNLSIVESMEADTLFGEAYIFSGAISHLVSVVAAEVSVVLEFNPHKLFETCANGCDCHNRLARNALRIVSTKIVRLTEKLGHIMRRTMREKLLSYLSLCAQRAGSNTFTIPYSRQQLADYLCVDRSALSHEMSRLKKEGLIEYRKNEFTLKG